uniref:Putative reverse transcriptase and intron maturase (Chloroplast) n=1 Tax=Aphanochaete confervicola TaxID=764104 RepID=A0A6H1XE42_9CHLO|nr:putative reverse transcriptase and intron maturase (chloroplast) [Aphanochaete confervicola]QJA13864.1 putative reverse transcriptase and intron maturase (chloroplast) [Aphanochaete confervicola]
MVLKTNNLQMCLNEQNSYEFSLHLIIEKFLFQLQHRIYKTEKQLNVNHSSALQQLLIKSWCAHVFVRWITSRLNLLQINYNKKSNLKEKTKKTVYSLLPEYYLTFFILEPQWEARFEKHTFGFRVGFSTYNAISTISKTLKKQKQYVLKFELNSEKKIKVIIPIKKKVIKGKTDFSFNSQDIQNSSNEYNSNFLCKKNKKINNLYIYSFYIKFLQKSALLKNHLNFLNRNCNKKGFTVNFNMNFVYLKSNSIFFLPYINWELKRYTDYFTYNEICISLQNQAELETFLLPSVYYRRDNFFNYFSFKNLLTSNSSNLIKWQKKKILLMTSSKMKRNYTILNTKFFESKFTDLYTKNLIWQIVPQINNQGSQKNSNKNTIGENKANCINFSDILQQIEIGQKFVDYWFFNLKKCVFFYKKQTFKKKPERYQNNFGYISSQIITPLTNRVKIAFFNRKIKQQFIFLSLNSQKQNYIQVLKNQQITTVDLKPFLNTNFSILSKSFFTNKIKKTILTKSKIDIDILIAQKKEIKRGLIFDLVIMNNKHQDFCYKMEVLIGQKFYIAPKFVQVSQYKLFTFKFLNSNQNSFYWNRLKLRQLCGFFTNILLHGIESEFYSWFNLRNHYSFTKFGCFLRYGNQILLLHPSLEYLKDSEQFFIMWGNSKNVPLKLKNRQIITSLINSKEKCFLTRDYHLLSFLQKFKRSSKQDEKNSLLEIERNKSLCFYKKNVFKQFPGNVNLQQQSLILSEFLIETKKSIFLEKYGSFIRYLNTKRVIPNKNPLKIEGFLHVNVLKLSFFPFVSYRPYYKTQLNSIKKERGLHFLGFYIYQFGFYKKLPMTNSTKFLFETKILPSKFVVKDHLNLLKKIIKKNPTKTQKVLIQKLSSHIETWSHYYKIISTKKIHAYCDYVVFKMLWKWACKRHSNKNKKWIKAKYFHCLNGKNWVFGVYQKDENSFYCLPNHTDVKLYKIEHFGNILSPFTFPIFF